MKPHLPLTFIAFLLSSFLFAQTWQDVGGGTSNSSHAMLIWNGNLVNLGSFNNNPCDRVASWDGSNWSCFGGGVGIVARAGTVWNGDLVVVGDFWNNWQPCSGCNGLAVWDGSNWTALDQGFNNDVLTCTVYNGDLIVGGDFTQADGIPVSRVVRWNTFTQTFESMGNVTSFDNDVRCMTVFNGELYVGGDFNNVDGNGPSDGLVKWDDNTQTWVGGNSGVDLIGGVNETVRVLYVNPNDGNLYMGGEYPELWDGDSLAEDYNMAGIAMYDGSNWFPLGTGLSDSTGLVPEPYCRAIHEYNGDLIVGGYFTRADGVICSKIARWDGTTFSPMGLGFDGVGVDEYVKSAMSCNGIFFAGGAYTQAEGAPMDYIAQWYAAAPLTVVVNIFTNVLCNGDCNGAATVTPSGGNPPYTYLWDPNANNQTTQQATGLCAGSYDVTVTDDNLITEVANVTITQPTVLTANSSVTSNYNGEDISCNGACDGEATATAGGGTPGYSYLWPSGGTNAIETGLCDGTFTVTITDANGCTQTDNVTLIQPTAVSLGTNSNPASCGNNDGDATVNATGGTGSYSYLWDANAGNQTTQQATGLGAGTYDVTVTDANNCTSVTTATVGNPNAPTATMADSTDVMCNGDCSGNATVMATGGSPGYTYLWSDPGSQTTAQATGLCTGTYIVTVTDQLSCQSVAAVTITEPAILSGNITSNPDNGNCDGDATVNATGGTGSYGYQWDANAGNQTTQTAGNLCSGIYCVTVTDSNQCTWDTCVTILDVGIDNEKGATSIRIFPNPFRTYTTISFDNSSRENHTLHIYNITGQMVRAYNEICTGEIKVHREGFPTGLYFFRLRNENRTVGRGKMIIN